MRSYKYNDQFFAQWLSHHADINKRDILNVLETKDYASLNRWAQGSVMPTASIIKLCNHFQIPIENFFIGMLSPVKEEHKETESGDEKHYDDEIPASEANFNSGKRAQLEARHTKEMYLASKKEQQREDEIRAAYDKRLDDMRREMMETINRQAEQIVYLSNLVVGGGMPTIGSPMAHEGLQSYAQQTHSPSPSRSDTSPKGEDITFTSHDFSKL